jgi:hypothetical protein
MTKLALPLSILAAAGIAACTSPSSPQQPISATAAPIVPQKVAYHPGTGVIQNVLLYPAPLGSATGGTATGATGHVASTTANEQPEPRVGVPSSSTGRLVRLAIKMDSGGDIQYVDTDSSQFTKGMRVELTPDGMIKKL